MLTTDGENHPIFRRLERSKRQVIGPIPGREDRHPQEMISINVCLSLYLWWKTIIFGAQAICTKYIVVSRKRNKVWDASHPTSESRAILPLEKKSKKRIETHRVWPGGVSGMD